MNAAFVVSGESVKDALRIDNMCQQILAEAKWIVQRNIERLHTLKIIWQP